ncbi:MAG: hypothetical protein J7L92_01855, partial [Dehalococcoidia bacterium]|nr:hypothetical protein [Dehalococcoidia bacterium]
GVWGVVQVGWGVMDCPHEPGHAPLSLHTRKSQILPATAIYPSSLYHVKLIPSKQIASKNIIEIWLFTSIELSIA